MLDGGLEGMDRRVKSQKLRDFQKTEVENGINDAKSQGKWSWTVFLGFGDMEIILDIREKLI